MQQRQEGGLQLLARTKAVLKKQSSAWKAGCNAMGLLLLQLSQSHDAHAAEHQALKTGLKNALHAAKEVRHARQHTCDVCCTSLCLLLSLRASVLQCKCTVLQCQRAQSTCRKHDHEALPMTNLQSQAKCVLPLAWSASVVCKHPLQQKNTLHMVLVSGGHWSVACVGLQGGKCITGSGLSGC